jgi:hypothetical protein
MQVTAKQNAKKEEEDAHLARLEVEQLDVAVVIPRQDAALVGAVRVAKRDAPAVALLLILHYGGFFGARCFFVCKSLHTKL